MIVAELPIAIRAVLSTYTTVAPIPNSRLTAVLVVTPELYAAIEVVPRPTIGIFTADPEVNELPMEIPPVPGRGTIVDPEPTASLTVVSKISSLYSTPVIVKPTPVIATLVMP